jgi:hypothetical protein
MRRSFTDAISAQDLEDADWDEYEPPDPDEEELDEPDEDDAEGDADTTHDPETT